MIIDLLLEWVEAVLDWVIGLFPVTDFDPVAYLSTALSYVSDIDYFLPLHEVFGVVVAVLLIFPVFAGVSLVLWIVALLRGGSARG